MTRFLKLVLVASLLHSVCLAADDLDQLPMNGIAAFEQLRLEYYIGAILTPSPSSNPDSLAAQPGPVRMSVRVTAERWPAMRFAQQWNQLILINNDSKVLNTNLMDVLGFTSFLKEDLIAGDRLTIDLTESDQTLVSLNGAPMFATESPALFKMLLRSWIGPRAPSSDFKQDMLSMPTEAAGSELIARYEALEPEAKRVAQVANWAMKPADAAPAPTVAPTAPAPGPSVAAAAGRATEALVALPPDETSVRARPAPVPAAKPESTPAVSAPASVAPAAPVLPKPVLENAVAIAAPAAAAPATVQPQPQKPSPQAQAVPVAATPLSEINPASRPLDPALQLKAALDSYNAKLHRLVNQNVSYPKRAISRNIEGLVVIKVKLGRNGELMDVAVAQSADRTLDNAALKAVKGAAPFPIIEELPEGANHTFLIPMIFKLDE